MVCGFIGSILGFLLSKTVVEDKLKKLIARYFGKLDADKIDPEKMYHDALKKLNSSERTTKEQLIQIRKLNRLSLHPDKNVDSVDQEPDQRFLDCESAFKTVEGYRKAKGQW